MEIHMDSALNGIQGRKDTTACGSELNKQIQSVNDLNGVTCPGCQAAYIEHMVMYATDHEIPYDQIVEAFRKLPDTMVRLVVTAAYLEEIGYNKE